MKTSENPAKATARPIPSLAPKVALMVETSNAYARGLLAGVEDYIRVHGPWNVHLSEHSRGDRLPKWLANWSGDGVLARVENKHIARALAGLHVPVVDLSSHRFLPDVPVVTTDNSMIARLAFEHFAERGFKHFAYCGDPRFAWSLARGENFDSQVRESGTQCEHYVPPTEDDPDSDLETDKIAEWLGKLVTPVAVFACYDARGQQVLEACQRAGLSVPEDVAVLGVDNDELLCALSPPPLSSVIPDTRRTGWCAAEFLARMMNGRKVPPEIHRIPPVGVATRLSTDTLAVDDPRIAHALQYIRNHACEGARVEDVLSHVPMARRVFERRLKDLIGRTPHEEIRRVQINRAKELLTGSKLTLAEIASRCGFQYTEYLSVSFKRLCGISPNDYRKRHNLQA